MNITSNTYQKIHTSWWTLKITYGLLFIIAGADKFTDIIVHWQKYLNPMIPATLGISTATFMYIVGIIELLIGSIILFGWTKTGAYLAATWLLLIVLNLLSTLSYFDIAVRDTVMAVGAITLGCLTTIKKEIEKNNHK